MGLFGKIKCVFGFHGWAPWSYAAEGACAQVRQCERCDKSENRVSHDWPAFQYVADDSCEQFRTCNRCGSQERQIGAHPYGEWAFTAPARCDQERTCTRCKQLDKRVDHQWDVWKHESPTSCVQVRFCRRCADGKESKQPRHDDHTWGAPVRVNCSTQTVTCTRCRESESTTLLGDSRLHRFGPVENQPDGRPGKKCLDCGHVEHVESS
jgi:hypothetical protein